MFGIISVYSNVWFDAFPRRSTRTLKTTRLFLYLSTVILNSLFQFI